MTDSKKNNFSVPFLDHLEDLRWRLLKAVISLIVAAGGCFYFADQILAFIIKPLGDTQLFVTEVTGSFYAYLKISLIAGVMAALPLIFYQLWSFISPGLYREEKIYVLPLVAASTLLFIGGAAFCYYLILPIALSFLIGYSGDLLSPIITVGSYISFTGMLLLAFGFGFEIPVIAYFLGKIGIITTRTLIKGRRYAVVFIIILAAILTPPDFTTQILLAVPLYILYEISIIIVHFTGYKPEKSD
ncbi:MAG: twin-arginine translocase subunit TatC [candidate division Zixibacteria bacterium]|nr:twin-arginine translocase subunit TatC [candidate division Zixibacteria bacterium]